MTYIKIAWNDKSATCTCLCDCFYSVLWARLAGRSVQTFEKWSIFSSFIRLGTSPQVFRQVKEWLILELHEVIRVLHVVACMMDFNLLCDQGKQEGVLKLMKNDHFLAFLAVLVIFSKCLGRWRSGLELHEMIMMIEWNDSCVPNVL